jgi:DNA polymerase V
MSINIFNPNQTSEFAIPAAGSQISTGFPSPAQDYLEPMLDLNQALIKNSSSTFFGKVKGVSKDAGVDNGDLLVIDKSLSYRNNAMAVCFIDGEFTLKQFKVAGNTLLLMPANKDYEPIVVKEDADFSVWGIVTYIIKKAY